MVLQLVTSVVVLVSTNAIVCARDERKKERKMKTEGEACKGHRAVSNPMTTGTTHRPQLEVALA